ncbi:MAG: 2'-5' RNA ligase family protein, partial [bacterium]
ILPAGFNLPVDLNGPGMAEICRSVDPFELILGGLQSFTSCPCFEVQDSTASLLMLRKKLKRIMCDPICIQNDQTYFAHVTVGLYDDEYPTQQLAKLMDQFEFKPVKPILVSEFVLASYGSSSIGGPIEVVAEFSLGSNNGS